MNAAWIDDDPSGLIFSEPPQSKVVMRHDGRWTKAGDDSESFDTEEAAMKALDPREVNALSNQYRREANKHNIGSPYRIDEYIKLRLKGKSEEEALAKVRENPQNKGAPEVGETITVPQFGKVTVAKVEPWSVDPRRAEVTFTDGRKLVMGSIPQKSKAIHKRAKGQYVESPNDDNSIWVMTTGDTDRDGETVDPEGLDFSEFDLNPVVIDNHNTEGPIHEVVIGKVVRHWLDDVGDGTKWPQVKGPPRKAQMAEIAWNMATPNGQKAAASAKVGMLNGGSISFQPEGNSSKNRGGGNHYAKAKLLEFTICPVGSNPSAIRVKSLKVAKQWHSTKSVLQGKDGWYVHDQQGKPVLGPFSDEAQAQEAEERKFGRVGYEGKHKWHSKSDLFPVKTAERLAGAVGGSTGSGKAGDEYYWSFSTPEKVDQFYRQMPMAGRKDGLTIYFQTRYFKRWHSKAPPTHGVTDIAYGRVFSDEFFHVGDQVYARKYLSHFPWDAKRPIPFAKSGDVLTLTSVEHPGERIPGQMKARNAAGLETTVSALDVRRPSARRSLANGKGKYYISRSNTKGVEMKDKSWQQSQNNPFDSEEAAKKEMAKLQNLYRDYKFKITGAGRRFLVWYDDSPDKNLKGTDSNTKGVEMINKGSSISVRQLGGGAVVSSPFQGTVKYVQDNSHGGYTVTTTDGKEHGLSHDAMVTVESKGPGRSEPPKHLIYRRESGPGGKGFVVVSYNMPGMTGRHQVAGPFASATEADSKVSQLQKSLKATNTMKTRKMFVRGTKAVLLKNEGEIDPELKDYLEERGLDDVTLEEGPPADYGQEQMTGESVPGEGWEEETLEEGPVEEMAVEEEPKSVEEYVDDVTERAADLVPMGVDDEDAIEASMEEEEVPMSMKAAVKAIARKRMKSGKISKAATIKFDCTQGEVASVISDANRNGIKVNADSSPNRRGSDGGKLAEVTLTGEDHALEYMKQIASKYRKSFTVKHSKGFITKDGMDSDEPVEMSKSEADEAVEMAKAKGMIDVETGLLEGEAPKRPDIDVGTGLLKNKGPDNPSAIDTETILTPEEEKAVDEVEEALKSSRLLKAEEMTDAEKALVSKAGDCVGETIRMMAKEGKDPEDPQTQAIAFSKCGQKAMKTGVSHRLLKKLCKTVLSSKAVRKAMEVNKATTLKFDATQGDVASILSEANPNGIKVNVESSPNRRGPDGGKLAEITMTGGDGASGKMREISSKYRKSLVITSKSLSDETGPKGYNALKRIVKELEDATRTMHKSEEATAIGAMEKAKGVLEAALAKAYPDEESPEVPDDEGVVGKGPDNPSATDTETILDKGPDDPSEADQEIIEDALKFMSKAAEDPGISVPLEHGLKAMGKRLQKAVNADVLRRAYNTGVRARKAHENKDVSRYQFEVQDFRRLQSLYKEDRQQLQTEYDRGYKDQAAGTAKALETKSKRLSKAECDLVKAAADFLDDAAGASDTPKRLSVGMGSVGQSLKTLFEKVAKELEKADEPSEAEELEMSMTGEQRESLSKALASMDRRQAEIDGMNRKLGVNGR